MSEQRVSISDEDVEVVVYLRPPERHRYEVVEITVDATNCEIGTILVDKNHCSEEDEPYRTWSFANMETGEPTGYIVAKHLGRLEEE